jgi:hypothetical protein
MWRPFEWLFAGDAAPVSEGHSVTACEPAQSPFEDPVSPVLRRLVGEVRGVAGPLRDLGAVRMLKDALAEIEGVESISVSELSHHNVQFEGWFGHERELIAELERALPFALEVESASGAELGLRLRAG